ncbi:M4 family metallopeptidase [Nocardioides marmorisolisilvae]|uniref:Neutral metalloproteinase n=1 Tax=Nocardioides marmorisolisilvae TaxID=1542737 RepID=A0A3N0DVZ6_9ACTN|nr:M4 family metallopeptidase [Nocardioides marmorisolisilvae]RNL79789.1 M4 family peptidase [Nocardioides marmorisolisilvae]
MRIPPLLAATTAAATVAVVALATQPAHAQSPTGQTHAQRAISALRSHGAAAHVDSHQGFRATATIVDADGTSHVRLQRTYRGLDVVGGDLVVHQSKSGTWRGVSQTLGKNLTLGTTATVSQASADSAATSSKANRRIAGAKAESSKLVVDATTTTPRLAWAVTTGGTQSDGTPSRLVSYVDARSGALIRSEQQIETADGSGQSLYAGTVPLQLTQSGTTYQLKDGTRGNTYTTDMKNKSDSILCTGLGIGCSAGTLFTSPDNLFGNGTTSSRESAAVDAQYGTNMTWDFYKTTFNRNGIFGNGTGSYNRVHYGSNYVNAFWDGTKMTYGDGDGTNYGPLTSLDVAGHEMSHGVTENSANLTYSGESGGLNESTSDIFGTMVEFFANNPADPGDYLIGEQFDKTHKGLRRMDNPASDGKSANCWSSSVGNLDVHYSSGVGNHFFYLLAEGSGPKTIGGVAHNSPTCNGSTVVGIGRADAEQIWYRALTVYMTSSTNYAGARTASLNAAKDLYGASSAQYAGVAAAWSAVSVN